MTSNARNPFGHQTYWIGVDTRIMNSVFAPQSDSMRCWAATAQMFLQLHGIKVNQNEFAREECGVDQWGYPRNCPVFPDEITKYLTGVGINNYGEEYIVSAPIYYRKPTMEEALWYLVKKTPLIVSYKELGASLAHSVLLTGAEVVENGSSRTVPRLIIRDPENSIDNVRSHGRKVVSALNFVNKIQAFWAPSFTHIENRFRMFA
jgi:hypothetical protein